VRAFLDKTQKDISSLISTTSDLSQLTSGQINQLEKEISDHIQSTQNIISRLNQALHIDGALSGMSG
jgi:ferritin-like metal-binding protein YciE